MSTARTPTPRLHDGDTVVLRPAHQGDAAALRRLAIIDSSEPLDGDVLVAEREGVILAAHQLHGSRSIADPFLPTADLVDLLQVRIALLRRTGVRSRGGFTRRLTHPLTAR